VWPGGAWAPAWKGLGAHGACVPRRAPHAARPLLGLPLPNRMASQFLASTSGASLDLNMFRLRAVIAIPPEVELYVGVVRWRGPLGARGGARVMVLGAPATRVRQGTLP
jgi:hypothetical protein